MERALEVPLTRRREAIAVEEDVLLGREVDVRLDPVDLLRPASQIDLAVEDLETAPSLVRSIRSNTTLPPTILKRDRIVALNGS